tara:strand:+ start:623 stop:1054 length:432 start_codon:yes stop_codon:yes gene_type:complete
MEATMITIMIIGLLSSVFGLLMIFAPSIVIKAEESANQLYMTDAALMKNRIPLGIFMLLASGFLFYTYYAGPYVEIIYLYLSIIAGIFGFLLLIKPNVILLAERKANKLYMTDAFFFKHRIILGIVLLGASVFMLRTYFLYSL